MLAIRMQRTGRHGHAMYRMIVQESRRTPTSGNVVALLGSYDPHTKTATFDKEKASYYLEHGAQPSDRVIYLLKSNGVKLPSWVKIDTKKAANIRNVDKLRRNKPVEATSEPVEAPVVVVDEAETEPTPETVEAPTATEEPGTTTAITEESNDTPAANPETIEK